MSACTMSPGFVGSGRGSLFLFGRSNFDASPKSIMGSGSVVDMCRFSDVASNSFKILVTFLKPNPFLSYSMFKVILSVASGRGLSYIFTVGGLIDSGDVSTFDIL